MHILNKVKIGGMDYETRIVDTIKDNRNLDGEIDYQNQVITLRKDLDINSDYCQMVFLHEIMHGIFNHCGIEQDENMVERITNTLYQVIKDNQDIFNKNPELRESEKVLQWITKHQITE